MSRRIDPAHGLNGAQYDAVHALRGPLLVLAGAGTGKTRVVTYRIAELIRSGIQPGRILAVTFTNKAAAEMQERATALLGRKLKSRPEISTFHSLCVRILRRHVERLGYPQRFAIYDRGDQEGVARSSLRQIRVPGEALRPSDLLAIISRWKSASVRPADAVAVAETDKEHLAALAYRRYQRELKLAGAVDFDDLLLLTEELFRRFPPVRRQEAQRFDHLLIDEYQDTNTSQYRIVRALAAGHRNLCVVGDDDQSIYGWRGAEVTHILNFRRDWPEATVVRLEENYRSTAAILEWANRLIAFNSTRHAKVLRAARPGGEPPLIVQFKDEEDEATQIVEDIRERLSGGARASEFAILFRTNEQPRPFEMQLRAAKVPYVLIGGMSFYNRKEVRDILAYLKLLAHPQDEISLLRIINKPPRGIGQRAVARLTEAAVSQAKPVWDVLSTAHDLESIPAAARDAMARFRQMLLSFQSRGAQEPIVHLTRDLIAAIDYRRELTRIYPEENECEARWQSVEEVVNAIARYEQRAAEPSLDGFLNEVALAAKDDEDDKDSQLTRNAVRLMTLHSAKGLEFPNVYLVGMEEGILPHHRSVDAGDAHVEEERRLCYVGVTRAQDRLVLSLPLTRMKWGRQRDTVPSRFLYELTGQAERGERGARMVKL